MQPADDQTLVDILFGAEVLLFGRQQYSDYSSESIADETKSDGESSFLQPDKSHNLLSVPEKCSRISSIHCEMSTELPLIEMSSARRPLSSHRQIADELEALRHRLKKLRRHEEHVRLVHQNEAKRSASNDRARKAVKSSVVALPPATSPRRQEPVKNEAASTSSSTTQRTARVALHEQRREHVIDMRREHLLNQCKIGILKNELLVASLEQKKVVLEVERKAKQMRLQSQAEKAHVVQSMRRSYRELVESDMSSCLAEIEKLRKEEDELRARLQQAKSESSGS